MPECQNCGRENDLIQTESGDYFCDLVCIQAWDADKPRSHFENDGYEIPHPDDLESVPPEEW